MSEPTCGDRGALKQLGSSTKGQAGSVLDSLAADSFPSCEIISLKPSFSSIRQGHGGCPPSLKEWLGGSISRLALAPRKPRVQVL